MQRSAFQFPAAVILTLAALALSTDCGRAQQSADGQQKFAKLGTCALTGGHEIANCRIGYRTWGKLNADRSNAILFPSWFSGSSKDIAGYVGAEKLVNPERFFIVAVDAFGDGVSSSPSNSTTQHGPAFPAFTTRDMVSAEYRLVTETLALKHLHAVVGISMGGMQTFEWMVNYPGFMDQAIPIVGSPRLTGYDLLLWHAEEDALRSDPAWHEGNYTQPPPMGAVEVLHQMNHTTPADYAREHPPEKFAADYAAYWKTGILPFDANDWLSQLEAMIHHDAAHGGSMDEAAKRVKARLLIVVNKQDHMVNPQPALDFAALIGAKTLVLDSDCGHRATACEIGKITQAVQAFLDGK